MSQSDDAKYLASLKNRYRKASKKARSKILDEYVETTGHHRKHAMAVLSGRRTRVQLPICRPRSVIQHAQHPVDRPVLFGDGTFWMMATDCTGTLVSRWLLLGFRMNGRSQHGT